MLDILKVKFILLISFFSFSNLLADNHNIYETLEINFIIKVIIKIMAKKRPLNNK